MTQYVTRGQKPHANGPNASNTQTLTKTDSRESAYTDDELNRIEETLGRRARRSARHRFDLEQMHLTEFTTNSDSDAQPQPITTTTPTEVSP